MTHKILVTGVGGPAAVSFMRAVEALDIELFAADMDQMAAGLYLVPEKNRWLLPAGADQDFVDELLALCERLKIDVVVPTVDSELLPIARRLEDFRAIDVAVLSESAETLERCLDKFALYECLKDHVPAPRTRVIDEDFAPNDLGSTFIVKPRLGSGARGFRVIKTSFDLAGVPRDGSYIAQAMLPGQEYSVDVVFDGEVYAAVPRSRLKVDSGVAVASSTVRDPQLIELAVSAARRVEIAHVANVQFKRNEQGHPELLEINARFPGTMPLTVASGINMPQIALRRVLGLQVNGPHEFRPLAVVRTFHETFVEPSDLERPHRIKSIMAVE